MTVTIGVILKRSREKRRLTQEDVSKSIKIPVKYIRALEYDDYLIFSDKVHSKGFLKLYAGFLNLNIDEVLALWRREYEAVFDKRKQDKITSTRPTITYPKFLVTPSVVIISFITICVIVFFSYLFYQYRNYTGAPKLSLYSPRENLVVDKDILDITGSTDIDSEVYVNNEKVILNPDASFADSIKLKEGLNTISVKSVNKLEKQTEYIRTVIYRPQNSMPVVLETSQSTKTPTSK
jgi:cytoskeletal protein RodZ